MKRLLVAATMLAAVVFAAGQGTFTIRRPAEGSIVREVVTVRIPRNSIPTGGYVGFWVNGKFLEATVPMVDKTDYIYKIDTKARQIPDGKMTLEAVLYMDYNEGPRAVNRSSVNLTVDNSASIKIPRGGLKLRYRFRPGTQLIYRVENKVAFSTISDAQNQLGGRAAQLPIDSEVIRYSYGIENALKLNGAIRGLLRMQIMPPRGKDYVFVTLQDSQVAQRFGEQQLAPMYMQVSDTGREIFGSAPIYVPIEGSTGSGYSGQNLFAVLPLPVLPTKGVKPGDVWQAPFPYATLDNSRLLSQTKLTSALPARGTLEGIEWERGLPCAKIRTVLSVGQKSAEGKKLAASNRAFADDKIELEETVWFAINQGVPVKIVRNITIDRKVGAGQISGFGFGTGGGSAGAGNPGMQGAPGGSQGGGPPGSGGGPGKGGGFGGGDDLWMRGLQGGKGGGMTAQGTPQQPGGQQQPPRGFGRTQRGGSATQSQFVRVIMQQVMVLES